MANQLHARLTRLRCPPFLLDGSVRASSVTAPAYRRPLLLWLFALYRSPELRFSADESWTHCEPSTDELTQWLRLAVCVCVSLSLLDDYGLALACGIPC